MKYILSSCLDALLDRATKTRLCLAVLLVCFHSSLAFSAERAIEIIDRMEALYQGTSSSAKMTMIVETPQYRRTMEMESSSMGTKNSFIRILSPRKDRGIATLKLDMEMWNYLPKINKVIKVPPSMMMGSWMGSDFTNDDLVRESNLYEDYDLEFKPQSIQPRQNS
ncbi:MAG: outer membrane lipoprotein-sorting protein [Proteobacteria bacterium]|nr:outer membrane lipoprotein-sorting protein [Pseudomonadota bacterium]